jgi:predicted hydrocarbon binding protein
MDIAASWPVPERALPEIYPAKIGDLMIASFEEVLGRPKFDLVLGQAGLQLPEDQVPDLPFGTPGRLYRSLEEVYGDQTARGICLRTGRVMFRRGLRAFSGVLGLTQRAWRLLPPGQKVARGLDLLAWLLNHYSDQRVRVERNGADLLLINERCPHCWELKKSSPCCQLPVGALQEGLLWASSARPYSVEETACRANGGPSCTYRIRPKGRH